MCVWDSVSLNDRFGSTVESLKWDGHPQSIESSAANVLVPHYTDTDGAT